MLKKGGSAVDAAIASLFCEGVSMPQSCGIGGGFTMVIYTKRSKRVETLIARETAAHTATEDMFNGTAGLSAKGSSKTPLFYTCVNITSHEVLFQGDYR